MREKSCESNCLSAHQHHFFAYLSPGKKRKRESSGEPSSGTSPFVLHGIKTPETPYGTFMGRALSPKTRKFWKLQLDELKRFDMTDEQKKEFEVRGLI